MDFRANRGHPDPQDSLMQRIPYRDLRHGDHQILEARVAEAYERCHPGDTFLDFEARTRFSKEDRGLLNDWIAAFARKGN